MGKFCIFAGAEIKDYSSIKIDKNSIVICADGGYFHTVSLGLEPDVLIGDFDTLDISDIKNKNIIRYPKEKNDTDSMLAIKYALENGADEIEIYGALGGRIDHTIANIQSMQFIVEHGVRPVMFGDSEILTVIKNERISFPRREGYYFSVISLSEDSLGVYENGVKYPLNNAVLTNGFPLGISNEIIADFCDIEVKKGILLIIYSKK